MNPTDLDPQLVIVGEGVGIVPAPTIESLGQFGAYVKAVVVRPDLTGAAQLTLLRIYRAPSTLGPWALVDSVTPSPISRQNNLFDLNPNIGRQAFYAATAVDALGEESALSGSLEISARQP